MSTWKSRRPFCLSSKYSGKPWHVPTHSNMLVVFCCDNTVSSCSSVVLSRVYCTWRVPASRNTCWQWRPVCCSPRSSRRQRAYISPILVCSRSRSNVFEPRTRRKSHLSSSLWTFIHLLALSSLVKSNLNIGLAYRVQENLSNLNPCNPNGH